MKRPDWLRPSWRLVLALLVACALLLAFAKFVVRPEYRRWKTKLQDMELAGTTISFRDLGQGEPAVVIITGMSCVKDSYYDLQKSLAETTRVLAYDRPGLGDSTANSDARTLDIIDRDLQAFLRARGVPAPYVMVGHSLGGHIIRYYAQHHPGEVAGLVFLDHPHEDWFNYIRKTWSEEEQRKYFDWWQPTNPDFKGVGTEELMSYERNCDLVRGIEIPPDVSVLMFTGNNDGHFRKASPGKEDDRRMWAEMQGSLLQGVRDARHVVDWDVGHMMHRDKPEMIASEIAKFIEEVRERAWQK